jgi:hypothetical protein
MAPEFRAMAGHPGVCSPAFLQQNIIVRMYPQGEKQLSFTKAVEEP